MNNKIKPSSPIGIFDSGLGGLTVLKKLKNALPNESFIYFGDTAHVPYGTKSPNSVFLYSDAITSFLLNLNVKLIIVACNTVSSVALTKLKNKHHIPIIDVLNPAVQHAGKISKSRNVGIIGTETTINSNSYKNTFSKLYPDIKTFEVSCPLFVPIIEEGWQNTKIAYDIAKIYLNKFKNTNIDTLILGCTHYPIMYKVIKSVLSKNISLVFSGEQVTNQTKYFLSDKSLFFHKNQKNKIKYFVSDSPKKFDELASLFLGEKLKNIKHISLL